MTPNPFTRNVNTNPPLVLYVHNIPVYLHPLLMKAFNLLIKLLTSCQWGFLFMQIHWDTFYISNPWPHVSGGSFFSSSNLWPCSIRKLSQSYKYLFVFKGGSLNPTIVLSCHAIQYKSNPWPHVNGGFSCFQTSDPMSAGGLLNQYHHNVM